MGGILKFICSTLGISLLLGYLGSLFTENEDLLALFYSSGVIISVLIFNKNRSFLRLNFTVNNIIVGFSLSIFISVLPLILSGNSLKYPSFYHLPLSIVYIFIAAYFEEVGWRGYLYKKLENLSWLKLNLVISTVWIIWHLPSLFSGFYSIGYPQSTTLLIYLINFFFLNLIYCWFRGKTGSIITPVIIHGFQNIFEVNFFPSSYNISLILEVAFLITYTVLILTLKAWNKPSYSE